MGFHPERVSSMVAAEAAVDVNEWEVDAGPILTATGMDRSLIIAVVATLAIAEVASSADFAGAASPADFAGMAFPAVVGMGIPAVVGEVPLTDVAGMALPAVAEGIPSAVGFCEALLAVAEVDSLFVAKTASPADLRGHAGCPTF